MGLLASDACVPTHHVVAERYRRVRRVTELWYSERVKSDSPSREARPPSPIRVPQDPPEGWLGYAVGSLPGATRITFIEATWKNGATPRRSNSFCEAHALRSLARIALPSALATPLRRATH